MKRRLLSLTLAASVLLPLAVRAADQATPDEAKAMAIKAAEYLKSVGPDKALPEFNAKDGPWHDRDLFVAVIDSKGVMVAHGSNPGLIGRNVLELKDVEGKPFNREWVSVPDAGWVTFKWRNLQTNAIEPKTCYVIHVGDDYVGVGAYVKS
ncbi:MAG: cache domain-containing protein [Acetobacteraceae bacterium]